MKMHIRIEAQTERDVEILKSLAAQAKDPSTELGSLVATGKAKVSASGKPKKKRGAR